MDAYMNFTKGILEEFKVFRREEDNSILFGDEQDLDDIRRAAQHAQGSMVVKKM